MGKTPILELKDLEVKFHTLDGVVHAVNGVSYSLEESKTLGVVGESGCGKSVSVLSVMRLIPDPPGKISGGKILLRGDNILEYNEAQMEKIRGGEIAMIFQDPMTSLNPVLTIGRQVSEAMIIHCGITPEEANHRAIEMLNIVGIPNAAERFGDYPHQFSGGMRQRAMIAMALSCSPEILIADEPTTALDVTIQAQIVDLVKRLRDQLGMSAIWIWKATSRRKRLQARSFSFQTKNRAFWKTWELWAPRLRRFGSRRRRTIPLYGVMTT